MSLMGLQKSVLSPIKSIYNAFVRLIIVPVVSKVAATSGIPGETICDERLELKPPKETMAVINIFRLGEKRSLEFVLMGSANDLVLTAGVGLCR